MVPILMSAAGLLALLAAVARYATQVSRGSNPRTPTALAIALFASVGLAALALLWVWNSNGPWLVVVALSLTTWVSATLLLYLHSQRRVPLDTLRVGVGEPLIPFRALTPEGNTFHSESLRGERFLLKFFRGEWCPFCQAELRRFDAMGSELQRHRVRVLALSKDAPAAARAHRERDSLRLELLCDPKLEVISAYGLVHEKSLEVSAGPRVKLFGLSVGTMPSFQTMAVPTTFLVDEFGIIRWIDQSDDYKIRSSPERVLAAIHAAFGTSPATDDSRAQPPDVVPTGPEPCLDC